MNNKFDVVVVGAGPNGLAAAITMARAGKSVVVLEAAPTVGGGMRTAELTLPGFKHDVCSAVFPMAVVSPFFLDSPLEKFGLKWIYPQYAAAHPLDNGSSIAFVGGGKSLASNSEKDKREWDSLLSPFTYSGSKLFEDLLAPLSFPNAPLKTAHFGLHALRSANSLSKRFSSPQLKALFAGMAGHSLLSFDEPISSAAALALMIAGEVSGWPIAEGGSQSISNSMAAYFQSLGGIIQSSTNVRTIEEIPSADCILLDVSAKQFGELAKKKLSSSYLERLRNFKGGPGVFKLDWALSEAVPWKDAYSRHAGTVHVGGSYEEIAQSEHLVSQGKIAESPFVLVNQPSLFDSSRAPSGQHVLWGYCHVPIGSTEEMTERIESQIERFAPGFRDCILAKKVSSPVELEKYNKNYWGGDISGGAMNWRQLFCRPVSFIKPYKTPIKGIYLCSSSTPPGAGVHGMCGFHAARLALREVFGG